MKPLNGEIVVPGDKSITHRSVLFGAIAEGTTVVHTTALGRDNFGTMRIMRQMGVQVEGSVTAALLPIAHNEGLTDFVLADGDVCEIRVSGAGLNGLTKPKGELNCGNSGTTARLLCGLLAGQNFSSRLVGDASLSKRPFKRVSEPLSKMGAVFGSEQLPLDIEGMSLKGISYTSPHASAQVKSAIILAGLYTEEGVTVVEPRRTRDHTERMLSAMGVKIEESESEDGGWKVVLPSRAERGVAKAIDVAVPGDFSAAAFFLVAGAIFPNSRITIKRVGLNPTRIGLYSLLKRMGAKIEIANKTVQGGEEVVDLIVSTSKLKGIEADERDVVLAIDEMPVFAVAAAFAEGTTTFRGAKELRVKESDRISMTAAVLKSFGVEVEELEDGMTVFGNPANCGSGKVLDNGAAWRHSLDHRIAMCGAILELCVTGKYTLDDRESVETSFPTFEGCLRSLGA